MSAQFTFLKSGYRHSTAHVAANEVFDYWERLLCDEFVRLECRSEQLAHFAGEIRGCDLGHIHLSEIASTPQLVIRTAERAKQMTEKNFKLSVQLDGNAQFSQNGREVLLAPGDFALFDFTSPYHVRFDSNFRVMVLQIPAHVLEAHLSTPEDYLARRVSSRFGVGALALQYLRSVTALIDGIPPSDRPAVADHFLELVALAFGSAAGIRSVPDKASMRASLLQRVRRFVDANIRNSDIDCSSIARHFGISNRHLGVLFHSMNSTVPQYILSRRLTVCRDTLADPALRGHSVTQLSMNCGFRDYSYFTTRFKERFGIGPREFRALAHSSNGKRDSG